MDAFADTPTQRSPLKTIIPIALVLGIMAYFAIQLTTIENRTGIFMIGSLIAFFVYIMSFLDIVLGIAIFIACSGLSPEIPMMGLSDLRLGDFIVPVLVVAWLTR